MAHLFLLQNEGIDPLPAPMLECISTIQPPEFFHVKTFEEIQTLNLTEFYNHVIVYATSNVATLNPLTFTWLAPALKPGTSLSFYWDHTSIASLEPLLAMAGWTAITLNDSHTCMTCTTPQWSTTTSYTLGSKAPIAVTTTENTNESDLIDEADLLQPEDLIKPECGPSNGKKARSACKNCTCGRADAVTLDTTDELATAPTSACGSVSNFAHGLPIFTHWH